MPSVVALTALSVFFTRFGSATPILDNLPKAPPSLNGNYGKVPNRYRFNIDIIPSAIRALLPGEEIQQLIELDVVHDVANFTVLENVNAGPYKGDHYDEIVARATWGGTDDRYQYTSRTWPWIASGKIISPTDGGSCSAAILGPRVVVTAKHCVPENIGSWGTRFYPAYDNGNAPFGSSPVTTVIRNTAPYKDILTTCGSKSDWAILITADRIGNNVGYLGIKTPDASQLDKEIMTSYSYPGDRDGANRPYRQDKVKPVSGRAVCDTAEPNTPVWTSSDVSPGQSGGVQWETSNQLVWGINSVLWGCDQGSCVSLASGQQLFNEIVNSRNNFQ